MKRLLLKDDLRKYAVKMLSAAYKVKKLQGLILKQKEPRDFKQDDKLRRQLRMMRREYENSRYQFVQINKILKNTSDYVTELLSLKRNVNDVLEEMEMIKENMPKIFSYREKTKKG